MVTAILNIVSELPSAIRMVKDYIEKYKKQQRIKKENKKRNELDKAIKEGDSKTVQNILSRTLSDIRRSVD